MGRIANPLLVPFLVVVAVHVTLRLTYFFWVGSKLRRERRRRNCRDDVHERWLAFKSKAAVLLYADGGTLGLLSILSVGSLGTGIGYGWLLAAGIPLLAIGIVTKTQAYRVVGPKGYYWYNSFCPDEEIRYAPVGIYRYFKNPMYGPGYLHAFGFALVFASFWGLVFGLFDWIVVWAFYCIFERPHTTRAVRAEGRAGGGAEGRATPPPGASAGGRETKTG